MARTSIELERVFGEASQGQTEGERAASSRKIFVRSQVQIAEDSERATGHRLVAQEALRLFGYDILARIAEDGAVPLITNPDEPAATIRERRNALGLTTAQVARRAGLSEATVIKAEKSGAVSPIRDLERIAQALALDEQALGQERGARGDEKLGVRLREYSQLKDTRRFSPTDVMALAEAAWVIRAQSELSRLLGEMVSLDERGFKPDPNYSYPAYEHGYRLASATRKLLGIAEDGPIPSIKSLIEEQLHIPVVQQGLAKKFAGATLAGKMDRGIVVNEEGDNANVWVRRMTMAHELGHLLWDPDQKLDRLKVDKYADVGSNFGGPARDPVEIRTNAFAISFLAPPTGVSQIVKQNGNLVDAIGRVMTTFGIGATAAKYHVLNICKTDAGRISAAELPDADDDWVGRENLTLDWFPLSATPISRRSRFALLTAKAFKAGLISTDTASMYLCCSGQAFAAHVDNIIEAFRPAVQ